MVQHSGACMLSSIWLFATPWPEPTRLLCRWDFSGKNTEMSCYFLLQGIKPESPVSPALAGRFFTCWAIGENGYGRCSLKRCWMNQITKEKWIHDNVYVCVCVCVCVCVYICAKNSHSKVKVKSLGRVWLLATPWTAAYQAPPSMGFSWQKYWSGVPLSSPLRSYTMKQFCSCREHSMETTFKSHSNSTISCSSKRNMGNTKSNTGW